MKPSLLLPTLLISTTALVAAVVFFVEDRSEHLASGSVVTDGVQCSFVVDPHVGSGGKLAASGSASAPSIPVDSLSQNPVQTHEVSDRFSMVASSSRQETRLPRAEVSPLHGSHEFSEQQTGGTVRGSSPKVSRRVTHPQAAILPGSAMPPGETALVTNRDPVVEVLPKSDMLPVRNATRNKAPAATGSAKLAPIAPVTASSRPRWPRGPFTPEEELYRAQFGAEALANTLRAEALGSDEP